MLSLPKQQSHKRDLPTLFEGNKQNEQQGPNTTFKNWAAEVDIHVIRGSQLGENFRGHEDAEASYRGRARHRLLST
eukprot:5452199-Amphidinium_carterae.1